MATAKKKVTRKRTKKPTLEEAWQALKDKIGDADASSYKMGSNYPLNTAINHVKFGLGFVTAAFPQKIEVTFKDGPKFLIQNRK